MTLTTIRMARNSVILLLIQLGIVSSVAAKYLYERWTSPRAWAQVVGYDPELPMRGRYLRLQLFVDGCGSTLPTAKSAQFPRNFDGTVRSPRYTVTGAMEFPARIAAEKNRLVAIKLPQSARPSEGQQVVAQPGSPCDGMRLADPVNFYLPEQAKSPLPLKQETELWLEVTVPKSGPPRPIQLALKQGGVMRPLAFR